MAYLFYTIRPEWDAYGLTMAGLIRNGPVSTMCTGLYSFGIRYQMADNMARGLPYDATQLLLISIRQLYGLTCIIGIAVLLLFLLWDIQPIRSTLKKMPTWNFVGRMIKKAEKNGVILKAYLPFITVQ